MHQLVFYPVGNGDSNQIILSNGKRILFDFRHLACSEDDAQPEIDLKKRLKEELDAAGRDYFDVVAFTHADDDHICGSTEFFELLHASKYQGPGRVKIKELWVPAAMLLEEATHEQRGDEFVILRQEARYRLLEKKGIRIFSRPRAIDEFLVKNGKNPKDFNHLFVDAGTVVPGFSLGADGVEFFCHSPFIKHCDDGDIIRNVASLMFNVRFLIDGAEIDFLEVGDTEWEALEDIVSTTKYHKNDDRLAWDIYNIPHHCSYLALGPEKGVTETVPTELVKELLLAGKDGAYIVSSSHPVLHSKDAYEQTLPPHIQARNTYEKFLKAVGGRQVLVTMEEPNAAKPEPLVFELTGGGVALKKKAGAYGALAVAAARPPRAG